MEQPTFEEQNAVTIRAGIARMERATDREWRREAVAFILEYMETHDYVFGNDLWIAGLKRPRNLRALGPVIAGLARRGLLVKTGEYRAVVVTSHLSAHHSAHPVWKVIR